MGAESFSTQGARRVDPGYWERGRLLNTSLWASGLATGFLAFFFYFCISITWIIPSVCFSTSRLSYLQPVCHLSLACNRLINDTGEQTNTGSQLPSGQASMEEAVKLVLASGRDGMDIWLCFSFIMSSFTLMQRCTLCDLIWLTRCDAMRMRSTLSVWIVKGGQEYLIDGWGSVDDSYYVWLIQNTG